MRHGGPSKPLADLLLPLATPTGASAGASGVGDPGGKPPVASEEPGKQTVRPSPSPRAVALSNSGKRITGRRERRHARAKTLDQLSLVGQEINTPPIPEDAIAFIATFLVHATLPYKDPGPVDYWERSNGKVTIVFEPGLAPKDSRGHRRRVGLPFGVYPRLILSWLNTAAVRSGNPVLPLGESFTDWIRSGLHLNPTGGVNGTITRIRDQMTRLLAMKITVTSNETPGRILNLSIVPIAGVAATGNGAAFWDPMQPDQHDVQDPVLVLEPLFFQEALRASTPFDDRVQQQLAKYHSCLAIDLYRLLTLKQFALVKRQAKTPELISWSELAGLLGHNSARTTDFKRDVAGALELLRPLYPQANAEPRHGGLLVRPGAPHIPPRPKSRRVLPSVEAAAVEAAVEPAGAALVGARGNGRPDGDDAS